MSSDREPQWERGERVKCWGKVERFLLKGFEGIVRDWGRTWVRVEFDKEPLRKWIHSFQNHEVQKIPKPAPEPHRPKARVRRRKRGCT